MPQPLTVGSKCLDDAMEGNLQLVHIQLVLKWQVVVRRMHRGCMELNTGEVRMWQMHYDATNINLTTPAQK